MKEKVKAERKKIDNEIIYKMYKSGKSLGEISRALKINKGTLSNKFKKDERLASLKKMREKKSIGVLLSENKEKIKRMMGEGMTFEEMAQVFKCKRETLYYWIYYKKILT